MCCLQETNKPKIQGDRKVESKIYHAKINRKFGVAIQISDRVNREEQFVMIKGFIHQKGITVNVCNLIT